MLVTIKYSYIFSMTIQIPQTQHSRVEAVTVEAALENESTFNYMFPGFTCDLAYRGTCELVIHLCSYFFGAFMTFGLAIIF